MSYSGSFRFQRYEVNKTIKNIRFYGYNGGMVSQYHQEKLADGQSVLIENCDVIAGGTLVNRAAYTQTNNPSSTISGIVQGRWKYQNTAGGQDMIAINGQLYTVSGNTYTLLSITGMGGGFQTVRPINAVQYRNMMYFATGSGIVQYDGTTASAITAYAPNGLEALYIGTNGYAVNPNNYLSNTTGAADAILGVTTSTRYGQTNVPVTFTAYYEQVTGHVLNFMFEIKSISDASYPTTPAQNWGTSATFTKTFANKDDYMIRVSLSLSGANSTILSQYVIPKYVVNTTPDTNPPQGVTFTNISTCNQIFVHYNRLCVYGDTTNPDFLYISHLNNFTYFPTTNVIPVVDPLKGALQKCIQYKNFLVCFTNGSIQQLNGQSPADFALQPIHMTLGCVQPYSVQVMQNYIAFVANNNGVYILKTYNYASVNDKLNVERFDDPIKDQIVGNIAIANAPILSTIYNNQYYVYIQTPSTNYIYRYYYDMKIWVREQTILQFSTMQTFLNVINTTSPTGGTIYQYKRGFYADGTGAAGNFSIHITSKDYDFNMPHHRKKFKQFQFLAELTAATTITAKIYGDNNLLTTASLSHDPTQNSDADKLKVGASGGFRYTKVDVTIPVVEETQYLGYAFIFKLNTPK